MTQAVVLTNEGNCGLITLFNPPVNALDHRVREGLMEALEAALADERVEWLLLQAGGRCFSAGADLRELGEARRTPWLTEVLEAIESSPKPCVAWMHGAVLGGGLELAMACHYRIAVPETRLGLPEVSLGLIPGAGGSQRLPRLVGMAAALELTLSAVPVGAERAWNLGLVDLIAPRGLWEEQRVIVARELAVGGVRRTRDRRVTGSVADCRRRLDEKRRALTGSEVAEPAPLRAIDALEGALSVPFDTGVARERALFESCLASPQRRDKVEAFLSRHYRGPRSRRMDGDVRQDAVV